MACKACNSENLQRLDGELTASLPTLKALKVPPIYVCQSVVVCLDCGFAELVISHRRTPNVARVTAIQISAERPNGFPRDGEPGGRELPAPFPFARDPALPPGGNTAQPGPTRRAPDGMAGNRRSTEDCDSWAAKPSSISRVNPSDRLVADTAHLKAQVTLQASAI